MRHARLWLCALVAALVLAPLAGARGTRAEAEALVVHYRRQVVYWQTLMRVRPPWPRGADPAAWRRLALRLAARAARPPHRRAWLCIHHFEGSWTADTGNGYYGGLQMDLQFQREYAPELLRREGTADNWRPLEQIWVAERARRSGRGFTPWPNTARMCGLL